MTAIQVARISAGGLGQAACARVRHHRITGGDGEHARQVKLGHAGHRGHVVERDLGIEVAFDVPERFLDRVHGRFPRKVTSGCQSMQRAA
jgi:hypothetical protein